MGRKNVVLSQQKMLAAVLSFLLALSLPYSSEANAQTGAVPVNSSPSYLSDVDLALVLSDVTKNSLDQLDQHIAMIESSYGKLGEVRPLVVKDLDPLQLAGKLIQALGGRFKTVSFFENADAAAKSKKKLILVVDTYLSVGTWPGESTTVELSGMFMDSELNEIANVHANSVYPIHATGNAKGMSKSKMWGTAMSAIAEGFGAPTFGLGDGGGDDDDTPSKPYQSYLPGFSVALNIALGQLVTRIDSSNALERYLTKGTIEPAPASVPEVAVEPKDPPKIFLISPEIVRGEAKVPDVPRFQVKGLAVSEAGIAEVKVRNTQASLSPADPEDLSSRGLEGRGVRFFAEILLEPGSNKIEITAMDTLGGSSNLTAAILRSISPVPAEKPAAAKPKSKAPQTYYGKSLAVVIGINHYDIWPSLEYAVNDAQSVKKKLEQLGFDEVIEILDKDATRARILTLLATELPKKAGPEDRVVIFFAGHGQTESLGEGKEQGYIIPVDGDISNYFTTAISMTQVRELSQRIPAKHLLYVMDACYSGQGFNRAGGMDPAVDGYIEKITSMRSVQMISAGGKEEQVMEQQGHGIFTGYFLRGLEGEADRDNDGVVTASELGAFLKPQVSRASGNLQTPQYGRLDGEGEVIFIVAKK